MSDITLFRPLSSKVPGYENRLTWAFLVVLKYDLNFQNFFRRLIETKLPHGTIETVLPWESARIISQTKSIEDSNRLVSVLLTDLGVHSRKIKWSDREAVYDGVIEYPDGLTFIIENKPSHTEIWDEQLCPSRSSYLGRIEDVELYPEAICLEWSEILENVLSYANSGVPTYGNRKIAFDFLSLVEELHPKLTPYRTFKICGDKLPALERRTVCLLDTVAKELDLEGREGCYLFRPGKIAERVYITIEEKDSHIELKVALYPADTVSQARQFFEYVDREDFLGLEKWRVDPNPHFSYMSTHLFWSDTSIKIDDYFDYFSDENCFGQMEKDRLDHLAKEWVSKGLISHETRREIDYQFNSTKRKTLNVVPGFSVSRTWKLREVVELEEQHKLVKCIIESLDAPLASWGEMLVSND